MKSGLTPRQAQALVFIEAFIAEKGWSPSLGEIAAGLGVKYRFAAHRLVACLVERGAITHRPRQRRSIEIVPQPRPPEGIEFLPLQLAVWVRVVAAKAGVSPLDVVTECVRDGYETIQKQKQTVSRDALARSPVAA